MILLSGDVVVEIASRLGGFNNTARVQMQLVCREWSVFLLESHAWAPGKLAALYGMSHEKIIKNADFSIHHFKYINNLFRFTKQDIVYSDLYKQACAAGRLDLVCYFTRFFDILQKDVCLHGNDNAFKLAARNGHVHVLEFLVETFDITTVQARAGNNHALREAATYGHDDVMLFLIRKFALTVDDIRAEFNHALRMTVLTSNITLLRFLLDNFDLTISDARSLDNWALRHAVSDDNLQVLQILMSKFSFTKEDILSIGNIGREFDENDLSKQKTRASILKLLIERTGVTLRDLRENDYELLLELISYHGNDVSVKLLLDTFSLTREDICAKDCGMLNVLAMHGDVQLMTYLIETYQLTAEDVQNCIDKMLLFSVEGGHVAVLQYLVKHFNLTLDINIGRSNVSVLQFANETFLFSQKSKRNEWPHWICNHLLPVSAGSGRLSVVKYLVETFHMTLLDVSMDDDFALRMAARNGHLSVIKYLVKKFNISRSHMTGSDNQVMYYAACTGQLHVMKYLVETFKLSTEDMLSKKNSIFKCIVERGDADTLQFLVDTFNLTLDHVRGDYCYALVQTYNVPNIQVLKCLLKILRLNAHVMDAEKHLARLFCAAAAIQDITFARVLVRYFELSTHHINLLSRAEFFTAGFLGNLNFFYFLVKDLKITAGAIEGRLFDAISGAVASGKIFILQYLFEKFMVTNNTLLVTKQNCFLVIASKNGQLPAMHFLITNFVTPTSKIPSLCFVVAARRGHVHILCYLMDSLNMWPTSANVDKMICVAAQHGHVTVMLFILERFERTRLDVRKCLVTGRLLETCPDSIKAVINSS